MQQFTLHLVSYNHFCLFLTFKCKETPNPSPKANILIAFTKLLSSCDCLKKKSVCNTSSYGLTSPSPPDKVKESSSMVPQGMFHHCLGYAKKNGWLIGPTAFIWSPNHDRSHIYSTTQQCQSVSFTRGEELYLCKSTPRCGQEIKLKQEKA